MSLSLSSSKELLASRSIFPLRRLLRHLWAAAFVVAGLTYAVRSLGAEFEYFLAHKIASSPGEVLLHLRRAQVLNPLDHNIRASTAYFFTAFRLYDERRAAITAIERELLSNPYAADLWVALAAYKLADKDEAGATAAVEHIKRLRPGLELVKE